MSAANLAPPPAPEPGLPVLDPATAWPIARLTYDDARRIVKAVPYAPGLPEGEHDVWCVPVEVPHGQPYRLVGGAPLFSLSATYTIAEGATADELLTDAANLMACAIETLELVAAATLGGPRHKDAATCAALYLFRQAKAALDMGHRLANADRRQAAGGGA